MNERSRSGGAPLKQAISRPLLILYGVGTMLGAGIYALLGEVAAAAGVFAPLSFIVAALLAGLTAASFAELSSRYPEAAGEATYVAHGFKDARIALAVGLLVAASGVVSSGVMFRAFAGYAGEFVGFPDWSVYVVLTVAIGGLAIYGIGETVMAVALVTIVEAGALVLIVILGAGAEAAPAEAASAERAAGGYGVLSGAVLAFYAFIGFEDMVNVAEEVKRPRRALPLAIGAALVASTVVYVAVMWTAVRIAPIGELAESEAPMTLVFSRASDWPAAWISAVAMFAVLNGAMVQVVMASRVLYGLAGKELIGAWFGRVNQTTKTPVRATALVVALVFSGAVLLPLDALAQATSFFLLIVFALVNLALLRVKRKDPQGKRAFTVPRLIPQLGAASAILFAGLSLFELVS